MGRAFSNFTLKTSSTLLTHVPVWESLLLTVLLTLGNGGRVVWEENDVLLDFQEWKKEIQRGWVREGKKRVPDPEGDVIEEAGPFQAPLWIVRNTHSAGVWPVSMVGMPKQGQTRSLRPCLTKHLSICQSELPGLPCKYLPLLLFGWLPERH